MSDRAKVGAGVLAVAAAVALFVVLQGGDDSDEPAVKGELTAAPQGNGSANGDAKPKPEPVPVIRIQGGQPVGGVQEVEVSSGDRARFRVVSDTDGVVHLHGYDVEKPVTAGSVSFDFPATLEGGYEIELHGADGAHSQIGELRVQPG